MAVKRALVRYGTIIKELANTDTLFNDQQGAGGAASFTEATVDWGSNAVSEKSFNIVDASVTALTQLMVMQHDGDDIDRIHYTAQAYAGGLYIYGLVLDNQSTNGVRKVLYLKG